MAASRKKVTTPTTPEKTLSVSSSLVIPPVPGNLHDQEYSACLTSLKTRFLLNTATKAPGLAPEPLFTTASSPHLWSAYIYSFPFNERQYHNCNACRHFIEKYGGLVTVNSFGRVSPAFWSEHDARGMKDEHTETAVRAMISLIEKAPITGVFFSPEKVWGSPITGLWRHFSIVPSSSQVFNRKDITAEQAMAEERENFKNVQRALYEWKTQTLETAVQILETGHMYRGNEIAPQARWLLELKKTVGRTPSSSPTDVNLLWRAVAMAPAGFCHPRSGMLGVLLDAIEAGKAFSEVKRIFEEKMDPMKYQRAQVLPAAGTVAQAEKLVEKLGVANSLKRKYATLQDVEAIWIPRQSKSVVSFETVAVPSGVFRNIKTKPGPKGVVLRREAPIHVPIKTMTWSSFNSKILPSAERIEIFVRPKDNFAVLLTAADISAPPILQWDRLDERNPVSWYLYDAGSYALQFGLLSNRYADVTAVILKPNLWGSHPVEHKGKGVIFAIEGARETVNVGVALFTETLKSEFHSIRSVIEEYSKNGKVTSVRGSHVIGPMFSEDHGVNDGYDIRLRVTSKSIVSEYILDRWD